MWHLSVAVHGLLYRRGVHCHTDTWASPTQTPLPESPGHRAGLRSGFIIQAIDSIPIAQIEKEVKQDMPPYNDRARIAQITKGILGRIYGDPETEVFIAYIDEGGKKREKKITRAKRSGTPVGPKGMFLGVNNEMSWV